MSWTAPSAEPQVIYVQSPPKPAQKPRLNWKSKITISLIVLGIATILIWYLRQTLDPYTKGILSGAACGLVASLPVALTLTILIDRRRASNKKEQPTNKMPINNTWNPTTGPMPPVVIYAGQLPLQSQPTRPLNWTQGPLEREFHVLGPPPHEPDTDDVDDLKFWGEGRNDGQA